MAEIRDTLILDIDKALANIDVLNRRLEQATDDVQVQVDSSSFQDLDRRLDAISQTAREVTGEVGRIAAEAGVARADFSDLARALNVSETRAAELTAEVLQGSTATREAETAARGLAKQLGLSDDEAKKFAQSMGKAANQLDQVDKSTAKIDGLNRGFRKLVGTVAAYAGAREFAQFVSGAVQQASSLTESTSKVNVVFGQFADRVLQFTDTAPRDLGLSTAAAREFTGTFGNLFTALGLSQQAAADLSPDIVQLGSDLASFNNLEVGDALEKLRSGLVGEIEPLRSLGISFNAAQVTAKALELGLADANGAVSEGAKVQARYALILEQTGTAQGDFARTADGLANASRTLKGEWDNLQASIGEALIPAILDLIPVVESLIESLGPSLIDAARDAGIAILGLVGIFDENARHQASALKVLKDLDAAWLDGKTSTEKLAVGLEALRQRGDLTADTFETLKSGLGTGLQGSITGLRGALSIMTPKLEEASAAGKDLGEAGLAKAREAAQELEPTIGFLRDRLSELINESVDLELASGGIAEGWNGVIATSEGVAGAADTVTASYADMAGAVGLTARSIKDAETAQKNYINTLRGAADPVFGAIDSYTRYQETLKRVDEDGKRTAEEQLELARAVLDVDAAFSRLDSTNIEQAISAVAAALDISRQAAEDLLNQLGLLDGRRFISEFELRIIGTAPQFTPEGSNPSGGTTSAQRAAVSNTVNINQTFETTGRDTPGDAQKAAQSAATVGRLLVQGGFTE